MQLPVFFGLGCEDLMRQSADGKGGELWVSLALSLVTS